MDTNLFKTTFKEHFSLQPHTITFAGWMTRTDGKVYFYIHPRSASRTTLDFELKDDHIICVTRLPGETGK